MPNKDTTPPYLADLLATRRIIVCLGSGGVGKTTLAAGLGLWGALNSRRTAILTIDPAHRLAQCLGLPERTVQKATLSRQDFSTYGLTLSGTLDVFQVDQQTAWKALIDRYIATPEERTRLHTNRFFQGLSQHFSGAYDYVALDLLATLIDTNDYDLIVVDTPPARHAIDFLRAPHHLETFLGHSASLWFLQSALQRSWSLFSSANRIGVSLLTRIEQATGLSTLGDIAEFFTLSSYLLETVSARLMKASQCLMSRETAFLLISTLQAASQAQFNAFCRDMTDIGVQLDGIIINRLLAYQNDGLNENLESISPARIKPSSQILRGARLKKAQRQWLVENYAKYQKIRDTEIQQLGELRSRFPQETPLIPLPLLPAGPVDLGSLSQLHRYLF